MRSHLHKAVVAALADASRYLPRLALALVLLLLAAVLIALVTGLLKRALQRTPVKPTVGTLILSGARLGLWLAALAGVLQVIGLDKVSLALAGSAAAAVFALANGASQLTSDILSGVMLAGDRDLLLGARVTAAGVQGIVEEVGITKTRLRDQDGRLHVIPNRVLDGGVWTVHAKDSSHGAQG
jgi:small conductance mechanosensitive channel